MECYDEEQKTVISEFIDSYRDNRLLWDPKDPNYLNKEVKEGAYLDLLDIYKKIKSDATIRDVKKKICSLRTRYRRELNKVRASESFVKGKGVKYQPTAWWYRSLDFIREVDTTNLRAGFERVYVSSNSKKPSLNTTSLVSNNLLSWSNSIADDEILNNSVLPLEACNSVSNDFSNAVILVNGSSISNTSLKRKTSISEYVNSAHSTDSTNNEEDEVDDLNSECDHLAKIWASKLKRLSKSQRLIVEKTINDVLFEAELGQLDSGYEEAESCAQDIDEVPSDAEEMANSIIEYQP